MANPEHLKSQSPVASIQLPVKITDNSRSFDSGGKAAAQDDNRKNRTRASWRVLTQDDNRAAATLQGFGGVVASLRG